MAVKAKKIEDPKFYTDIGKQFIEKSSKQTNERVEVRELSKEMNKDYMSTLVSTALKDKDKYEGCYYVVVITKVERLITTCIRNLFFTRQSCPTPNCDQTVYKFDPSVEHIELLWVVPSKKLCKRMYKQRFNLSMQRDPLLPFVKFYVEGGLLAKAMELNNEKQGD